MTKTWGLLFVMIASTTNAQPQPCCPLENLQFHLQRFSSPLAQGNRTQTFITAGYVNNIDPRVAAAGAIYATSAGTQGPCSLVHDPFHELACQPHVSWTSAIDSETNHLGSAYIHTGQVDLAQIAYGEGWADCCPVNRNVGVFYIFEELFGNSQRPVVYSSSCCGDCNGDKQVNINELVFAARLGVCNGYVGPDHDPVTGEDTYCFPLSGCRKADADADGHVMIYDILRDVTSAFSGCPAP